MFKNIILDIFAGSIATSPEVEAPRVTPQMPSQMRSTQSKALKPGRKKGKGSNGKGEKSKGKKMPNGGLTKARSKLSIIKSAKGSKGKASPRTRKATAPADHEHDVAAAGAGASAKESQTPTTASKPKAKAKAKAKQSRTRANNKQQQRHLPNGKNWAYEVLPNQKLGCCACRFIFNGCVTCRKSTFKGKSPSTMRAEQQAQLASAASTGDAHDDGSWEGWGWCDETEEWVQETKEEVPDVPAKLRKLNSLPSTKQ